MQLSTALGREVTPAPASRAGRAPRTSDMAKRMSPPQASSVCSVSRAGTDPFGTNRADSILLRGGAQTLKALFRI